MANWPVRLSAIVPLMVYLALGMLVVQGVPSWEAPDEPWHVRYAQLLATGRRPTAADTYEALQPPGYYLWPAWGIRVTGLRLTPLPPENAFFPIAIAAFVHPAGDPTAPALRVLRTFSGFLGLLTLCLAWATSRVACRRWRYGAMLASGLVAVWPQFQFIAHVISNDVLAAAGGGLVVYGLVEATMRPWRAHRGLVIALLGLLSGLIVKLTVVGLAPAVAVVLVWALMRRSAPVPGLPLRHHRRRLIAVGLALGGIGAGAGYFGLLGEFRWQLAELGKRAITIEPRLADVRTFLSHAQTTLRSLWSEFGWQSLSPPPLVPESGMLLACLAAYGLWQGRACLSAGERRGLAVATLAASAAAGAAAKNLLARPEPQGRFLFPALVAMVTLWGAGVVIGAGHRHRLAAAGVCGYLLILNAALFGVWIPRAYASYGLPTGALALRRIEAPPAALVRLEPERPLFREALPALPRGVARLHVALARASGSGYLEWRLMAGGSTVAVQERALAQLPAHGWLSLDVVPPRPLEDLSLEVRLLGDGWAWLWAMQPPRGLDNPDPEELMLLVASQAPPWRAAP